MSQSDILNFLKEKSGFNYDTEVPEDIFEKNKSKLHTTNRTVVTEMYPEAESYRDKNRRRSIHLTDFREVKREKMASDVIVAHLEHFNPEHHPVLHFLVDLPLWYYRNRIREENKL